MEGNEMQDERTFTIIAAGAAIVMIVLLYSAFSIQSTRAKIEARDMAFAGLDVKPGALAQIIVPEQIGLTTIIDSNKPGIISLSSFIGQLKQLSEIELIEETLEMDSREAQQLIQKYNIKKIPTVILQGETEKVAVLKDNWPKLGTTEPDGAMVLRNI